MKNSNVQVSLYVTVPLIVGGIALLTGLTTYNSVRISLGAGRDPLWPFAFWLLILVLVAGLLGLLIASLFLKPMQSFMRRIEEIGLPTPEASEAAEAAASGAVPELRRFSRISDQVTGLISDLDASEMFPDIIQQSQGMIQVLSLVSRIAPSDVSVLILGESGTGKELIAHSIHQRSHRASAPFVAVNCAGIPENMLESELFGHERGSFTGAVQTKTGKFELASGGTLFLDEIGDMPLSTQAKILRAIQEREIERVGGTHPIQVDLRVVAATNRDVEGMVHDGTFRQDLYYRLNAFTLELPPLRDRRNDIPPLARHFATQFNPEQTICVSALSRLSGYDWPGNIRELRNVIETASALAEEIIEPHHLPIFVTSTSLENELAGNGITRNGKSLDDLLVEVEKRTIENALEHCAGIQKEAAQYLGIKERSLWHRIAKYHIDVSAIKESFKKEGVLTTNRGD